MKRGMLIGLIACGIVVILLWYFLLFSPTSKDLNDTRDEVSSAQGQKEELENTIRRLQELSRNATQQAATLRTLRAAIPATPDLGAFILQANDIATAAGIDWLSIAPTPPTATIGVGPTSTIAISIQVDGGFFEVLDYLNRLEDLDRLVLVDSINVSASSQTSAGSTGSTGEISDSAGTGGAPDLSVTLTGRMFTGAAAAVPGAAGGTVAPTPTTPGGSTATTTPGGSSSNTTPPASSSGTSS